jgi:hypothetical protein
MTSSDKFKQLFQQTYLETWKSIAQGVTISADSINEYSIVCKFVKTIQYSPLV